MLYARREKAKSLDREEEGGTCFRAPLRRFLVRLREAVISIDARRVRDDRKVMLGCLQRDLTAAGEALEVLLSEVAECAALYEHLQAEAARIARRDGCAIAPDDPNSYRGRPRTSTATGLTHLEKS